MPTPAKGYFLADGTKVPGVTTILGRFKDSGALLYWACEQGKAIQRGEISKLYDKRDAAADAGTLAHLMVERHINGEHLPDHKDYPEDIFFAGLRGYENWLRWSEDNGIVVVAQELQLVSETYKFGGTPDGIGIDSKQRTCLLDYKTSSGIYTDYLVQLGAYKLLWEDNNPNQPINGGCHLLRFSKEHGDFHHHFWEDLSDAEEQFLLFVKAYELDKKLKKRL